MKFFKNVAILNLKKKLTYLTVAACLLANPFVALAAPPDPGAGAGNPDGVPFDSNMNLMFLAVGVVFAAFVLVKQIQKRKVASL
jgi:hypothetical protein